MSVNRVILLGNVGRDPEIRHTQGGTAIANLSIATSESWTDKRSGERQEKTEWHRVVIFNPHLVGIVEKYVKKGARLYVEGQVQTRKWAGQDGIERLSTEVVLPTYGGKLLIEGSRGGSQEGRPQQATRTDQKGNPEYAGPGSDLSEEIPF